MARLRPQDLGFGRLFASVRDAVVVGEVSTNRIVLWNPAAERIFGYSASQVVGRPIETVVPPQLRDRHRAGMARYLASGQGRLIDADAPVVLPALRATGEEIVVELTLSPIQGIEVEGTFVMALIRDVTERKRAEDQIRALNVELGERVAQRTADLEVANAALRAHVQERAHVEEALRASEERYRTLFEVAPDVIFGVAVPEGTFTDLSPSFEAITGWSVSDWIGRHFAHIVCPEDLPLAKEMFGRVLRGEAPPRHELRVLAKSGEYLVGEITAAPRVENGRVVGELGIARDVTRRKRMEAENARLYESEQRARQEAERALRRLQGVQAITDVALAHLTQDELLQESMARVRQVLGTDTATVLLLNEEGDYLEVVASSGLREEVEERMTVPVGKGFAGRIAEAHAPLIAEDLTQLKVHSRFLRERVRSLIGAPLVVEGRLIGVLHTGTTRPHPFGQDDLEILQLAADRLALVIDRARLYRDEQRARARAEATLRERDEFLSVAAHELKTPITTLRGFAQLLLRRFDKEGTLDPERVLHAIQNIDAQSGRLARLINLLLDLTRIEAGRLGLEKERTDLTKLVEDAVADAQEIAAHHSIVVRAPEQVVALVDPLRIEQVLVNLLDNAVKYSPQGGPIEVAVAPVADGFVRIGVRDYGTGIAADQREQLFERFHRAHTKSYTSGLGLGLYISKQIVELHGGRIEAQFPPDGGTCFVVTLPTGL